MATVSCDSEGDDNVQWWDWSTNQEDPEGPVEPEEPADADAPNRIPELLPDPAASAEAKDSSS